MITPTYTVEWNYRANDGRKADRFGPYMLQAELVRSYVDPNRRTQKDRIQLGVVSLEDINDVAHRHAFWVVTEAALHPLELDTETLEQVFAELSRVVPLPTQEEIINYSDVLAARSRAFRKK